MIPERLSAALADRYRIERELGAGGMATVYLADDLKHDRKVAIKVLKPELAALVGAERFLAEIKTTANLQHPHILPLHDSGQAEGFLFYVMPYVEGDSVRDRLDSQKQLGVEESVAIARKVADALDYAHGRGIVHRDIKPANILLSERGEPLVADFGIALAVAQAGGGRITETGLSLGTPHYMSPEQATGERDVDPRSDVYALGCVLYEMLAGEPPFAAPTAQAVLMRVLTTDPAPVSTMRRTVPPNVEAAISRALEKLPADRFDTAQAFASALADPVFRYSPTAARPATVARAAREPAAPSKHLLLVTAATALVALVAGYGLRSLAGPATPPQATTEFELFSDGTRSPVTPCCWPSLAISPRGDRIVYIGSGGRYGLSMLWQRAMDTRQPQPIQGTDDARSPFFSDNGQWIAYVVLGRLMKVRLDGGQPEPIADVGNIAGGTWGSDGTIVFAHDDRLFRVSSDGGTPEQIAAPDTTANEVGFALPHFLPDGRTVLFGAGSLEPGVSLEDVRSLDEVRFTIEAIRLGTPGERFHIGRGREPRYVEPGFLVYADGEGSIVAQPFDAGALRLEGEPVSIAGGTGGVIRPFADYGISRTGTLVYREATRSELLPLSQVYRELVLVDRSGREEVVTGAPDLELPRFSPSGRYIAYSRLTDDQIEGDSARHEIWVWDLDRGVPNRVTTEGENRFADWASEDRLIFARLGSGILSKARDGSGPIRIVVEGGDAWPTYSPNERWLLWLRGGDDLGGGRRIWYQSADGSGTERLLIGSRFEEFSPTVSPNGRWIAYVSQDTEDDEVYVASFPDMRGQFKVSPDGGRGPVWSADGRELFYIDYRNVGSRMLTAVEIGEGDSMPTLGAYTELFGTGIFDHMPNATKYDVHPDGQRFVFAREPAETDRGRTIVVVNALGR